MPTFEKWFAKYLDIFDINYVKGRVAEAENHLRVAWEAGYNDGYKEGYHMAEADHWNSE